ncbi:S1 RNA-binding domain-containing protein [Patescibacteria group bacterium]
MKKEEKEITQPENTDIDSNDEQESSIDNSVMGTILQKTLSHPELGELTEGSVIGIDKNSLFIDLSPFGTGIIYGREFVSVRDVIKNINTGDTISAKIVDIENEDGYIELSLKEARQALTWAEAEKNMKEKVILELPIKEANKGGLIVDWQGVSGFLPASQLNSEHYPRVDGGSKDRILEELKKLVGQKVKLMIIGVEPKEDKLIFSEKNIEQKNKASMVEKYNVGDELDGEVTGVVDFGIFVKLEDNLEGLVHISEISWSLVGDLNSMYKVGDTVKVKVIEVEESKVSLSIKALTENPWKEAGKKYKIGDKVDGVVIKFNKHGALVSIEEGIAGLVHISKFGTEEELKKNLELGRSYNFEINIFEPNDQKMTLSLSA